MGASVDASRRARDYSAGTRDADTAPRSQLLIAVDLFEELFTLCRDEQERATFVSALVLGSNLLRADGAAARERKRMEARQRIGFGLTSDVCWLRPHDRAP